MMTSPMIAQKHRTLERRRLRGESAGRRARSMPMAWLLAVASLCAGPTGCTSLDLKDKLSFGKSADDKPQVPTKIIEVWSEEVLQQQGEKTVRGFAGRVMFYAADDSKPVKVDGTFSLFVFDDVDRDNGFTAPERRFVYRPEELAKYYSKSELGHSYSIWLPWDEVGGPERKLCLIARFEPKKGPMVVAKPCLKTLSGVSPKQGETPKPSVRLTTHSSPAVPDADQASAVRTAGHEAALDAASSSRQPTTITIDVPPSFGRPTLMPAGNNVNGTPAATTAPTTSDEGNGRLEATSRAGVGVRPATDAGARSAAPATTSPAVSTSASTPESRAKQHSEAPASPATRFARPRFPVRREPIVPPNYDRVRRTPLPATSLSRLPPTPRSEWPGETRGLNATEEPYAP
jgi:hypothetical protein